MKKYLFLCLFFAFTGVPSANAELDTESFYDFSLSSIKLYPSAPLVTDDCKIVVKAKNNGKSSIVNSSGINSLVENFADFEIDKSVYPVFSSAEPIAPGAEFEFSYTGRFQTSGSKDLSFTIDSGDQVDETSETNNFVRLSSVVYDPTESDLVVNKISVDVLKPLVNEPVLINIEIKNRGKNSLSSNKGFMFYDSGTLPSIRSDIKYLIGDFDLNTAEMDKYPETLSALNSGSLFTYKLPGRFNKSGEKKIEYTVNANKRLIEKNYDNNLGTSSIVVYETSEERDFFSFQNIKSDYISSSSIRFTWETLENVSSTFLYRQSTVSNFESVSVGPTKKNSVVLSNLQPDGIYYYTIRAVINNATKETDLQSFIMPSNSNIVISDLKNSIIDSRINVTWKTNLAAISNIYYRKAGEKNYQNLASTVQSTTHSLTSANLGVGEYEYFVYSISAVGTNVRSEVYKVIIGTVVDATNNQTVLPQNTGSTATSQASPSRITEQTIKNNAMYNRLKGKIVIRVGKSGEAYYISPVKMVMYYLGRPEDAFRVMREKGSGISNVNLEKIPVSLKIKTSGADSDKDALSDPLEDALGTNKNKVDSDSDSFSDKTEIEGGFNPTKGKGAKYLFDNNFANVNSGKIFLAVQRKGEAWYVNPSDKKRYFLGRPADAFGVMRGLGVGVSEGDFGGL